MVDEPEDERTKRDDEPDADANGVDRTVGDAIDGVAEDAGASVLSEPEPENLLLDQLGERLETFQLLRKDDDVGADDVLNELGASTTVDRDIVLELSSKRPLGHPNRFPEAHALAVRSLEVLDRNGSRSVPIPNLGPLKPIASYLVALVTQFIVRSYLGSAIDAMRRLYQRREANALLGDPARPMLTRARIHAERLTPSFKRNPLGVPAFLFGGAFISSITSSLLQSLISLTGAQLFVQLGVGLVFVGILGVASWVLLRGAAVARRRIILSTEEPLKALWQTVGRAGNPPKDQSVTFAFVSIALLTVSFLVMPLVLGYSIFTQDQDEPVCEAGSEITEIDLEGDLTAFVVDDCIPGEFDDDAFGN